jgi:uncharacterized protein YgbK (DUF1537 family)
MRRVVADGHLSIVDDPSFVPIHLPAHFRSTHIKPSDIAAALAAGHRIITVEASTDGDLDAIAAAALASPTPILCAGSSGLAAAIARSLPAGPRPEHPSAPGRMIFCVGSEHPVTIAQQEIFRTSHPVYEIDAATSSTADLAAIPDSSAPIILHLPRGRVPEARVAQLLEPIRQTVAALMVTGGDTASLLYRALNVTSIALQGDITSGIPHGLIEGGSFDAGPIVTKSGGFGRPDAFIEIADFFACPQPN